MNVNPSSDHPFARTPSSGPVPVTSLGELDALVGRNVTGVSPAVYWEDTCTQWRFESLPEALEAMRDPFFAAFAPEQERCRSSLKEVHEYPGYSAELEVAMTVVEQLSAEAKPLTLWLSAPRWSASFPGGKGIEAPTPALAICMAALRTRGIEVVLAPELIAAASRPLRLGSQLSGAPTSFAGFR